MSSQQAQIESLSAAAGRPGLPFADGGQIAVIRLTKWLDWVTQKNHDVFIALPMIQRGSVWKANAIADLWDSLLRGMPVGSFTVSRFETEEQATIRVIGEPRAETKMVKKGSLSLLDGQQRTLAMCIGWKEDTDRRVWVDFGQPGIAGQPFRLRVTTEYQPFGFNQNDQSKKLQRREQRKARDEFNSKSNNKMQFDGKPDYKLPLNETEPYGSVYPLDLHMLIEDWQSSDLNLDTWIKKVLQRRSIPDALTKDDIEKRIRNFAKALQHLFQAEIALVRVKRELVEHDVADEDNNTQPALVVLFERIANGGTRLSNSDYIFSLIKHRFPDAHNFVQELHEKGIVSSLLSANDLVMTAVRLAAHTNKHDGGKPFPDNPTPTPKEFGRMLKLKVDGKGDFIGSALMPLIKNGSLLKAFSVAHQLLEFRPGSNPPDPGLPKLAFPLLQRQLVQVLVLWIHRRQRVAVSEEILRQQFENSRAGILRFVLFWLLCVGDREKDKEAASKSAFSILSHEYDLFPDEILSEQLCKENVAVRLQHPDEIKDIAMSPLDSKVVRNWTSRFGVFETDSACIRDSRRLYSRWCFRKNLLLWLQRETLAVTFKDSDPLAGRDEETPYDYDHVCPRDDWASDGRSHKVILKQFCQDYTQAWLIGDCIGNFCVLESGANRSYGKSSPALKLNLNEIDSPETLKICEGNAIDRSEAEGFNKVSVEEKCQGEWDEARALDFQKVVERRAFRLFKQYFKEGGFDEWFRPKATENSDAEITDKIVSNVNTTTNIPLLTTTVNIVEPNTPASPA
jgi:hypothetical protein